MDGANSYGFLFGNRAPPIYPEDIAIVVRLHRGTKGSRKYTAKWHASFLSCVVHGCLEIGLGKVGMEL